MADVSQQEAAQGAGRARWTGLVVLGLVMVGLAPFLMLLAELIWGLDIGVVAGFFVALVVVPWIAAFLAWRYGTWAKVVAIVIALAAAATMFWTAFGLVRPASFFDFVPGLLVIPGVLITIVASVGAIVAGRRGHTVSGRAGGERRAVTIVVAVVGGLALLSAVLTVTGRTTVDATNVAAEARMKDFLFDQPGYQAPGGSQVVVRNQDPFAHTFTIDELGIDVELGPNSSALVDVPAQAGTYVVYCRFHTADPKNPSDDDMASALTIE